MLKKLSMFCILGLLLLQLVPNVSTGLISVTEGLQVCKKILYSGYTYTDGTHVDSAPTTDLLLHTRYDWWLKISVYTEVPLKDVRLSDRFGAEFGVEICEWKGGDGGKPPVLSFKGRSKKATLKWEIGDLDEREEAWIILHVWTDKNPAGKQEFTSCGTYEMNSGATVKGKVEETGEKISAVSNSITVSTVICPYAKCKGVKSLTLKYTGSEEPLIIKAYEDKKGKRELGVWVVYSGDKFTVTPRKGKDKLGANTYLYIYDMEGNLLETQKIHTSCSQPLYVGMEFGSLTVTAVDKIY